MNVYTILLSATLLALAAAGARAQVVELSGVINRYVAVTRVDSCGPTIDVDSTSGFDISDRVLLVQMKGATIDTVTTDDRFGRLLDVGLAGAYHFGTIAAISGRTITLLEPVARTFDVRGFVQLVRVPRHRMARVVDTVRARAWDGRTGGVIALEVMDTLWLDATIDASASAFAGGRMRVQNALPCDVPNRVLDQSSDLGSGRGETIALYDTVRAFGGRGRAATAGGGGNSSNTGGGGGAGIGDGGRGGGQYTGFCTQGTNSGEGGAGLASLSYDDRLYVGGGAGGGHANDFEGTIGGRGGGIVAIRATHLFGNGQYLRADGASPSMAGIDGAGGGGGGGTVLLEVDSLHSALTVSARGGEGGSGRGPNGCHGPGGGGGGGLVLLRTIVAQPGLTTDVRGGSPGVYTAANLMNCQAAPYGAEPGTDGTVLDIATVIEGHVGGLFSVAPIYGAPGDRVELTLNYRGALDSAFRPIRGVTTTIEVDPLLLYLDSAGVEEITPGTLRLYRPLASEAAVLARYSAVLLAGPTNESIVRIISVEPDLAMNPRHCAWAARTTNAPMTIELCEVGSLRTVRVGSETALRVVAPNPVRGTAVINFSVSEDGPVRLTLVDAGGREPFELYTGRIVAGEYSLPADLAGIAPGRYLLRLSTARESVTTPLVVQR